jgi:hypothetical protein
VDATQGYDEHARSTREAESSPDYIASIGEGADVVLDPQVTELAADELRTALFDAITEAQDGMPAPGPASFEDSAADINTVAERRFAEISEALHDISRRAVRR